MKKIFKSIVVWVLISEAKLVLKKYKPKIIAITGSVGKTSTKDAIYTVLSEGTYVRKSQKSFNSEIGIPLTILGVQNAWDDPLKWSRNFLEGFLLIVLPAIYPKTLILEVGADRPGDIQSVTKWIHPDIVVITKFSKVPVHVEFFDSPEAVKREKGLLAKAVKRGGTLVLNADDEDVMSFAEGSEAHTITYGMSERASVKASVYHVIYSEGEEARVPKGISYKVGHGEQSVDLSIEGTLGMQALWTTLAALAVGVASDLSLTQMSKILGSHETPPGRMKILEGVNSSVIIDDSYNSSPIAQREALDTLASVEVSGHGRKIAILGDMLELGTYSATEHKAVGERAAKVTDVLITVGVRARGMRDSALAAGMNEKNAVAFEDSVKAGEYARGIISAHDVVLVKGSQGTIRMERAVEAILAHPEDKSRLLVRQEPEWQKR